MVNEETIRKQYAVLRVITLLLLVVAPAAYTVMVYVMNRAGNRPIHPDSAMVYALFALAAATTVAVPIFGRLGLWKTIGRSQLEKGLNTLQAAQVLTIIRLAFIESIYIYGLILFFITGLTTYLPYFAAIGVLCSILYWPTYDRFAALVRSLEEL